MRPASQPARNAWLPIAALAFATSCAAQDAGALKLKVKDDRIVVADKSKPVRAELEVQYARLAEAVVNRDHAAFQALRTDDFHTVDENGRPHDAQEMSERARAMLANLQPPIETRNEIGLIRLEGDDAIATVRQYFSKMRMLDGRLRRVETWVTQEETWTRTADGWKLRFVDGVRDPEAYVDGKRIEPGVPYDPDAPEYVPPTPAAGGGLANGPS